MRLLDVAVRREMIMLLLIVCLGFTLSACQPAVMAAAPEAVRATETERPAMAIPTEPPWTPAPTESPISTEPAKQASQTATPTKETITETHLSPTPTSALVAVHELPPEAWKSWPVIPQVPELARQIYQHGLALGNDPHAFSILGDCQSLAETFLGIFDADPVLTRSLPPEMQAAIANFAGSFDRQSPTIKGGTTAGAILWSQWHENAYTCQASESPLACELRLHKPSIVIINLGTHYETRNINYLRKILDELIAQGIVPILSTKADNRELDDRLNMEMALLAVEYDIPMWNFYAAVSDLPNNGVGVKAGEEHLGEIYLSEEGLERHRFTALQALTAVWLAVQQP